MRRRRQRRLLSLFLSLSLVSLRSSSSVIRVISSSVSNLKWRNANARMIKVPTLRRLRTIEFKHINYLHESAIPATAVPDPDTEEMKSRDGSTTFHLPSRCRAKLDVRCRRSRRDGANDWRISAGLGLGLQHFVTGSPWTLCAPTGYGPNS